MDHDASEFDQFKNAITIRECLSSAPWWSFTLPVFAVLGLVLLYLFPLLVIGSWLIAIGLLAELTDTFCSTQLEP
jgi:hypothetical protein